MSTCKACAAYSEVSQQMHRSVHCHDPYNCDGYIKLTPTCESKCAVHCEEPPPVPERCGNCRYWCEKPPRAEVPMCRKDQHHSWHEAEDWCGEYKRKEAS